MGLKSVLKVEAVETLTATVGLATATVPATEKNNYEWFDGTAANQANKVYTATRTLTASSTEDLDLAGGLTDAFGATITFARIKAIIISAASANTNNVLVGGAASNQFINWVSDATDKIVIRPGGVFAIIAPDVTAYAVTAGTGDLLRVGNSGAGSSVTYDIVIVGASS